MKFPQDYTLLEQINYLQRQIIICSIVYYELDDNLVSDYVYDSWCKQLVELQAECEEVEQSNLWYVYYDFDGSTGFDLFYRLTDEDKEEFKQLASKKRLEDFGIVN